MAKSDRQDDEDVRIEALRLSSNAESAPSKIVERWELYEGRPEADYSRAVVVIRGNMSRLTCCYICFMIDMCSYH